MTKVQKQLHSEASKKAHKLLRDGHSLSRIFQSLELNFPSFSRDEILNIIDNQIMKGE